MNKSKIILASTGGAIGLVVLVMAYLAWNAYSAKVVALEGDDEEGVRGLEQVTDEAARLSRNKKGIYPSAQSVREVVSNQTLVAAWKDEAFRLAARGDRPRKVTTPAQFKADMVAESKRLIALPGGVLGKLAKDDFGFGPFREYIAEGKMPAEQKLSDLTRQWDDLTMVFETLSECGVVEVVDFQLKQAVEQKPEEEATSDRRRKRRPIRRTTAAAAEEEKSGPTVCSYVVTFLSRPQGFVRAINAFETSERFVTVEDFSFAREKDVIAEALGGDEKKTEEVRPAGRRGRRRGAAAIEATEEKPDGPAKNGIITDPLLDAPLKVTMVLAVADFQTLEEGKTTEEVKK